MKREFNTPTFRVRVFVYHPGTGELAGSFNLDQAVAKNQGSFNRACKLCSDEIERLQSLDGLRYVAYFPVWDSWRCDGNRLFESVIGA